MNLACAGCYSGSLLISNINFFNFNLGLQTSLSQIPPGTIIYNLILNQNVTKQEKYIKSAGTFGQIVQKDYVFSKIRLPSGKIKKISVKSIATVGVVSNQNNSLTIFGSAGNKRNVGRRPIVRGIVMNPVDHPHGGRTNGGKPSVTPWGFPTKNKFYLGKKK
jgi:large subunit ribosomal protein L2